MNFRSSFEQYRKYATPAILAEEGDFVLKIAETKEERQQAFDLRSRVFRPNTENPEELLNDRDSFDEEAFQLIAVKKDTSELCGTFRFMNHPHNLWSETYSSNYFDVSCLPLEKLPYCFEIGRVCIAPKWRNGTIVSLFWHGSANLMCRCGARYMVGSVSVFTDDSVFIWAMFDLFRSKGCVDEKFLCQPSPKCMFPRPSPAEFEKYFSENPPLTMRGVPPLLREYVMFGSKIISVPSWCRDLACMHFLFMLDFAKASPMAVRYFMPDSIVPPYMLELP